MFDTICAIATSVSKSSISIIRISGNDSLKIAKNIFTGYKKLKPNTIHYGFIKYNNEVIDEVLVSYMKGPNTFTGEDVIEINCHGGYIVTNKILEIVLLNGARLAEAGEFSKRAFLNGKMDMIKASSIMDLIDAQSETSRKIAMNGITSKITSVVESLRNDLVSVIGTIEVNIDYPEYVDVEVMTNEILLPKLIDFSSRLDKVINTSTSIIKFKDGIDVGIIGKPNVGKSSLLNKLTMENKAIVTDIEGTTRDTIESNIYINDVAVKLIDTAGIRETENIIEKMGIEKSIEVLNKADLILYVVSNNDININDIENVMKKIDPSKIILVVNKSELDSNIDKELLEKYDPIYISCVKEIGIENLRDRISSVIKISDIDNGEYVSNVSSLSKLKECKSILDDVFMSISNDEYIDIILIDIKRIWNILGGLIGATYDDELIDSLFANFCLGK